MNKTHRHLLGVLLLSYGLIAVLIILGRVISELDPGLLLQPKRTPPQTLATFQDFDTVRAKGDFLLEIIQDHEFTISYVTNNDIAGDFEARLENDVLILEGRNNTNLEQSAIVRVTMPSLSGLFGVNLPEVTISGFEQERMFARTVGVYRFSLMDSHIQNLEVDSMTGDELYFTNVVSETRLIKTWGARHDKARIYDQ